MPEPRPRIMLRLPATLHGELVRRAKAEHTSLNQLVVALLAGATGFALDAAEGEGRR